MQRVGLDGYHASADRETSVSSFARPQRVLIVHHAGQSFAERDERLLGAVATVRRLGVRNVGDIIRSGWASFRSDAVLIWFASLHAVVPLLVARLRRLPVVIVPGGYEVTVVHEHGYGWQGSWLRRRFVTTLLRRATTVAAVSPSIADLIRAAAPGVVPVLIPNTVEHVGAIPPWEERPYDVATSFVPSQERIKGVDLFLAAASRLPNLRFLIVGETRKVTAIPANVTITGLVSPQAAEEQFAQTRVYVQATRGYEAFGSALLEAMARGATPVVSEVGGMPWVVSGAGVVVKEGDVDSLIAGILEGLQHPAPAAARQRVSERFSPAERVGLLMAALDLDEDGSSR